MVAYSFREQFVHPIMVGLGMLTSEATVIHGYLGSAIVPPIPLPMPKRQTIRAHGKRRHARPGDELQLYTGMRTKACRLIGRATCSEVKRIILYFDGGSVAVLLDGEMLGPRKMKAFAQADGFKDALEMAAFWSYEHGTRQGDKWEGLLIRWTPIANTKAQP